MRGCGRTGLYAALALVLVVGTPTGVHAAGSPEAAPRDVREAKTRTQMLNELNLRAAQVALDNAGAQRDRYKREYENALDLSEQGIVSKKELDEALTAYTGAEQQYEEAQIELERTKLSFLANATHVSVLEAKKYYDSEGRRKLDLVLENASSLTQAESALGLEGQSPDQIRALLDIENVIVSVLDGAVSVGKPYEQIIPVLPYGGKAPLSFVLLKDVDQAGVRIQYLERQTVETVHLEKESLQRTPTVTALQFSQEGQLGRSVGYDLDLEMLVTSEISFSLALTNLPPEIQYSFVDVGSGARITRVRFDQEVSRHRLRLELSLPDRLEGHAVDESLSFQVWVLDAEGAEQLNALRAGASGWRIPPDELGKVQAGRCDLALIPRGAGRLETVMDNFYAEIKPEEVAEFKAEVQNTGTLALSNVSLAVTPPRRWTTEVVPERIEKLAPGEMCAVVIRLVPEKGAVVGEYEAGVKCTGETGSEKIQALDKTLRVRIAAVASVSATLIVIAVLVALMAGIVAVGVKLSRR